MKKLLLTLLVAIGLFFSSCSTTHKLKTSSTIKLDSVTSVVKDTTSVTKQTIDTHGFDATGVDIEFDYGTDSVYNDTSGNTKQVVPSDDAMAKIIKNAISASGNTGRLPNKIKIHLDTVKDTTSHVVRTDSTHSNEVIKSNVKRTTATKSKTVVHTGPSIGLDIAMGIGLLLLILGVGYVVYKKLKIV